MLSLYRYNQIKQFDVAIVAKETYFALVLEDRTEIDETLLEVVIATIVVVYFERDGHETLIGEHDVFHRVVLPIAVRDELPRPQEPVLGMHLSVDVHVDERVLAVNKAQS